MEVAELLRGSAHCASRRLVRQRLESGFEPVQRQLYTNDDSDVISSFLSTPAVLAVMM